MRTATKYDYPALRQSYVTSEVSIRELARNFDIESAFSTIAQRARKEHWDEDRAAYRAIEQNKVYEAIATQRARKLAEIEKDTLEVIHAAVLQAGVSLSDREVIGENGQPYTIPAIQVSIGDLTKLIDKIQLLAGRPTEHTREDHLGVGFAFTGDAASLPAEVLRELAALARSQGAGSGSVGHSSLPGLEGAVPVN